MVNMLKLKEIMLPYKWFLSLILYDPNAGSVTHSTDSYWALHLLILILPGKATMMNEALIGHMKLTF